MTQAFTLPSERHSPGRHGVQDKHCMPVVEGDVTRDWVITEPIISIWPYDSSSLNAELDPRILLLLWPYRSMLSSRVAYGHTQLERGLTWFEYSMFFTKRFRVPTVHRVRGGNNTYPLCS